MPPAATGAQPPRPARRGSLVRHLVLRTVLLVAALAVALSLLSTLGVRQLLINQLDQQLDETIALQQRGSGRAGPGEPPPGINSPTQPAGTLIVVFLPDQTILAGVLSQNGVQQVPTAAIKELGNLQLGTKTTLSLTGLGRYRVIGLQRGPRIVVVGLPTARLDAALVQLIGLEAILAALAVLASGLIARALVVRSLRPLSRLADTARTVSQMPLGRGSVDLSIRVPEVDADPSNEVGEVGQAFNHMLSNVETALGARQVSETKLRRFIADASHELRNPLASIRGYAELTRRSRADLPDDTGYALSRIEAESVRMSRLVEDLLLLARLDSGPTIAPEPVDLTEVVMDAVSDARAAGADHHWRLAVPVEPVIVSGEQRRLVQVMVNLLANARTHTPPGTTVHTAVSAADGWALVTVTDNGPGIPPDLVDKVFERFTRADVARARSTGQSTGLGLAIVAAVVQAHHGQVHVTSRPGETTFAVRLPLTSLGATSVSDAPTHR